MSECARCDQFNETLESVRVQVLHAEPGDLVVLSFPYALSAEQADRLREAWKFICPRTDVRCCVLDQGGHVDSIIRPTDDGGAA